MKQDGKPLHIDTLNLSSAPARAKFLDALAQNFDGIDRDDLDAELMALAASNPPDAPAQAAELQEADVRRVVRPELFHTASVSGLTVPVVLDAGGKLVPRWRTYLRWANGRRDVTDVPDRLELPDGAALYVAPDPRESDATNLPAWSASARRDWLAGDAGPEPAQVFANVSERFSHYPDLPTEAAPGTTATLALWTMLSYCYPVWDAVPYLFIGGPMGTARSVCWTFSSDSPSAPSPHRI